METGVPVRTASGRGGGWSIDPAMTLPPVRFTADEASALTVALAAADVSAPYAGAARTAAQKIAASMTAPVSAAAQELAARIVALPSPADTTVRAQVERALTTGTVLRLSYVDAGASKATAWWNRPGCSPPTAGGTSSPGAACDGPAGASGWTGSQGRLRPRSRLSPMTWPNCSSARPPPARCGPPRWLPSRPRPRPALALATDDWGMGTLTCGPLLASLLRPHTRVGRSGRDDPVECRDRRSARRQGEGVDLFEDDSQREVDAVRLSRDGPDAAAPFLPLPSPRMMLISIPVRRRTDPFSAPVTVYAYARP